MLRGTWLRAAVTCTPCPLRDWPASRVSPRFALPLSLPLFLSLARSLSLSLPCAARCLALSPCALPEMSHYNGTSSTPHSLFSSPTPCGSTHVNSDSTLLGGALEAAGEEAGTRRRKRRGRGGGKRLAPLPALLAVVLTPATHPAQGRRAVVRVGTHDTRTMGAPRPLGSLRISSTPPHPRGAAPLVCSIGARCQRWSFALEDASAGFLAFG